MSDPTLPHPASAALPAVEGRSPARFALPLFLGVLAWRMLAYTLARPDDDPWLVGDWLINYAGGMVRRGLTGAVLLGLSTVTGIEAATWSGVLQLLCLAALLIGLYRLARPLPLNLPLVLLLASPALLLLYVHNPHGGFRKEVLLLGLLAAFCTRMAFDPRPVRDRERLLLAAVLALLVLCHEMLFAYMPLFVIALRLAPVAAGGTLLRDTLILLPAAACTLWIVLLQRGDASQVAAICASWAAQAPRDCQGQDPLLGAISFLAVDTRTAVAYTRLHTPPAVAICYAAATLLSCLPLALIATRSNVVDFLSARQPRGLAALVAAVLAQTAALNVVAADHGRLLHILITGLSLLLLLAMTAQGERLRFRPSARRPIAVLLAVLFIFGWKLKHFEMTPDKLFWWSSLL